MQKTFILYSLLLITVPLATNGNDLLSPSIEGKVIRIKDGDTIDILFNNKPLTIRLAHVDCPEKKQPYGEAARQFTATKCFGQKVKVLNDNRYDRNKRLIGVVINEQGENVNRELVKAGLAWHFKKYSTDTSYANLENSARLKKKGLWSDGKAVAPWLFRKVGSR